MGTIARPLAMVCVITLSASCGGGADPAGPGPNNGEPTRNIARQAGNAQTAPAGIPLPAVPAVRVTNESGAGVAGVAINFAVAAGGGSVGSTSAATDANGDANPSSWTLGQTPGVNSLTATISGSPVKSVTFTATGVPGPAAALTITAGNNQTVKKGNALPVRPAVRVADQFANVISGAPVTFAVATGGGSITGASQSTGTDGVAAVGGWTLGNVGSNTLTATVTGATFNGNPITFTATGDEISVIPSQDTSISGTVSVTRFVVPVGRTVTATTALVIVADSTIEINGILRATCLSIIIKGKQIANIAGTIDNSCAALSDNSPNLSIDAEGGYDINGATLRTSGDLVITNDSTLSDADFPGVPAGIAGDLRALSKLRASALAPLADDLPVSHGTCGVQNALFAAPHPQAPNGANAPFAIAGKNGRLKSLWCRGNLAFRGGVVVLGQHGGDGGTAEDLDDAIGAETRGGNGGRGGNIKLRAYGVLSFADDNQFLAGSGGDGGTSTSAGGVNTTLVTAPYAKARGGDGGNPGIVDMAALGEIRFFAATTIRIGNAGDGGNAKATGRNGEPAGALPAQNGGDAEAIGGKGGSGPGQTIFGNLSNQGFAQITGGNAGKGGDAEAIAGNGGAASEAKPDGGHAGDLTASGGAGGDALFRDFNNHLIGVSAEGGNATFRGGNGAAGWTNNCTLPLGFRAGGRGGDGGIAEGGIGAHGAPLDIPTAMVVVNNAGNAGVGGMGLPAGATGGKGDHITQQNPHPNRQTVPPAFNQLVAFPCMAVTPPQLIKSVAPQTQCATGFLDFVDVRSFSPELITVVSNTTFLIPPPADPMNPVVLTITNGNGIVQPNGFLGGGVLRPLVGLGCLQVPPLLGCVRVQATMGPTTFLFTFPYRVKMNSDPVIDVPADQAACKAAG